MRSLRQTVENGFHSYGLFASKHPWYMIVLSGFLILLFCYPMFNLPLPGNEPSMFYSNGQHFSPEKGVWKDNFDQDDTPTWLLESEPTAFVQQLIVKSTVRPWPGDESSQKEAFRSSVSSVFPLLQVLQEFTYNGSSVFEECYHFSNNVIKANKKLKFLFPNNGCLVVSPALFWEGKESMFQIDKDVKKTIQQYSGKSTRNFPSVEDLLFGIPSKYNGVKSFNSQGSDHVISYAVTLVLRKHDPHLLRALQNHLWKEYGSPLLSSYAQRCWDKVGMGVCQNVSEIITHIHLKGQLKFSDLYILFPMYVGTGFYIYFSVKQIHFLKSKFGMACSAVVNIMASLMTSVGLSVHFGLTLTIISSWVYPFFGGLYCLHNILVITKSIVASSSHEEVEERVAAGLRREAFSIFKNLFYEGLFVAIGVWIGSPEIKEICGFAGVAILSVFLLHMVFFVPVLSIDIRRRVDFAEEAYSSATIRFNSRKPNERAKKEFEYERRLLENENGGRQENGTIFSKRLRFMSFMVNYRVLKMTVLIAITALMFLSITENKLYYETPKLRTYEIPKHDQLVGADNVFSDIVFNVNDLTSSDSLSFRHWPNLFAYYNVSLENRHISILPPILIPIVSKLDLSKINSDSTDKIEKSRELIAPLVLNNNQLDFGSYEMETRLQYYMTLLTGAFAGIFIYMFLMYLYKCICTRNYANWSKRYRRCHSEETYSSAAGGCVPLALSGHTCTIGMTSVDGVSVASCDLSGELRVWDTHSGECTCTMSRRFKQISLNQIEQKNGLSVKQHHRKRSLDSSIVYTKQRPSVWSLLIKEQLVFAGCENGSIEIWDSVNGKMKGLHDLRKAGVVHLACEDTRLVCARVNGTLDFFDLTVTESFADSHLQYRGHDRSRANGFIHPLKNICNYENLQLIQRNNIRSAHQQPITALKIAQSRVFTGSSDHTLRMFNVTNGACEQTFFGHSGAITVIYVDTSEPFGVMSGASDGSLCVWNLHSGNYSLNLTKHTAAVSMICCTQWHIVSTAQDDCICVWSRESGKLLRTVPLEQGCSNALCLLNNNWCVSGGLGKILLWDMRNGNVTRTIKVGSGTLALPCVQQIISLGNLSIICVVGRELYVVRLPSVLEKNDH